MLWKGGGQRQRRTGLSCLFDVSGCSLVTRIRAYLRLREVSVTDLRLHHTAKALHRMRGVESLPRGAAGDHRRRYPACEVRINVPCCRDKLLVPPVAPDRDVRALGSECAELLPILG